jgi:pantetheine-phosphate adenylyltransferase
MEKIAVFPGSFDPVTKGHINIIERGLKLFDKIVVGIGTNSKKQYMFPLEQRIQWIKNSFGNNPAVEVHTYEGLTVNFCKDVNSEFIIRGIRTSADFEFERAISHINSAISTGIETVFIISDLQYAALSSSIVRDVYRNGGAIDQFVPESVNL